MIHSKPLLCFAAFAALGLLAAAVSPALQDLERPKPTEQHKHMLAGAGEWEGTLTSYMTPGAPQQAIPAHETITAIGEFWTMSSFNCEFMGAPYVGSGHYGYDPVKKKFIGTWVDNMSSYLALMEGEIDAQTNALVFRWQAPDRTGKLTPHRSESTEAGNTRTMTFYVGEGTGTKSMVIEMKRKGGRTSEAGAPR